MDRIPIVVDVEGERIILGTIQITEETEIPYPGFVVTSREVLVNLGDRQFKGSISGPPFNVFTLREEI